MHMNVVPFIANCCFPPEFMTVSCVVIVTEEETSFVRKGKRALNRTIKLAHISSRKISPSSTIIRHEERIASEGGITNDVDHICGSMSEYREGYGWQ